MEEEEERARTKSVAPSLILGFVLALVAMGLPMIGITVNLYLGALALSIAFALLAFGFWKWEKTANWETASRVNTLWVLGLIYFSLTGFQVFSQYKRDHPQPRPSEASSETARKPVGLPQQYPQFQERALPESSLSDKPATKTARIPKAILPAPRSSQPTQSVPPVAQQAPPTASSTPAPQQTVNAPNGIGSIGGTLINPQVNNFGKIIPPNRTILLARARIAIEDLQKAAGSKVQFRIVGGSDEINAFSNNLAGLFVEGKWILVPGSRTGQLSASDGQGHISHGEGVECGGVAGSKAFDAASVVSTI